MDGLSVGPGDLVRMKKAHWDNPFAGIIGIITGVIIPNKQFYVHWFADQQVYPSVMWTQVEAVNG